MKFLGIDYGEKKVGIAVSDDDGQMAFPRSIVPNDGDFISYILELVAKENIDAIVIGESKDFRGEDNPIMKRILAFKASLEEQCDASVHLEPELLSTQEARRGQEEAEQVDASAAAIILQSFINKQKNNHDNHR